MLNDLSHNPSSTPCICPHLAIHNYVDVSQELFSCSWGTLITNACLPRQRMEHVDPVGAEVISDVFRTLVWRKIGLKQIRRWARMTALAIMAFPESLAIRYDMDQPMCTRSFFTPFLSAHELLLDFVGWKLESRPWQDSWMRMLQARWETLSANDDRGGAKILPERTSIRRSSRSSLQLLSYTTAGESVLLFVINQSYQSLMMAVLE